MGIFRLPDLGEGLPDAEIHQWYVKVGEHIQQDHPLVSMETAKAVVDVPAPQSGVVEEIFGQPGDVIKTGSPLVRFAEGDQPVADAGTVVGKLQTNHHTTEDYFMIGAESSQRVKIQATPAVRLLAKQLEVDLRTLKGTGPSGLITQSDVEKNARSVDKKELGEGYEPLKGTRRTMLQSMTEAHRQIVPVTLYDEVDIEHWSKEEDLTVRLIRAIASSVEKEPALNAWFDSHQLARKSFREVNLGLAVDGEAGLFVPVIHHVTQQTDKQLREAINLFKQQVNDRTLLPAALKGATIVLSNFGKFSGRFATPIIVPPTVAILGVGRVYAAVVPDEKKQPAVHALLPLSLTFDHRAVTGGEATRFLGAVMHALSQR